VKFVVRVRRVHRLEQRAHGRMQAIRRQREVEDLLHLGRGLPARAGIGHGERRGNALRGEKQVAGLGAEVTVQVHGEGVVPLGQRCLIGGRSG